MVSYDNLNVTDAPQFNDDITSTEYHTYLPYVSTSLKNDDEIRIPIHHQDLYTLPSQSYLHIEGKLKKPARGIFLRRLIWFATQSLSYSPKFVTN